MPGSHTLEMLSAQLTQHVNTCEAQGIANAKVLEAIASRIEAIEKLPMKAVRYVGGIVVTAALTLMVQNMVLHQETAAKVAAAAQQATDAAGAAKSNTAVIVTKLDKLGAQ